LILVAPELLTHYIITQYVQRFLHSDALLLMVFALRSVTIFGYGIFRLQRGKHAPYAETILLLAICAFILLLMGATGFNKSSIPKTYAIVVFSLLVGAVIFLLQRLKSPAWKWKTPE